MFTYCFINNIVCNILQFLNLKLATLKIIKLTSRGYKTIFPKPMSLRDT